MAEEEEDQMYVAFIKAFAPVLLHLSSRNSRIQSIINEFKKEDAAPDHRNVEELRTWVDSKQDEIDALTDEQIQEIMANANLQIVNVHQRSYSLGNKRRARGESCAITMEPIKRGEYYVDFLDNGKPYKVDAILQYYKLMKETNLDRNEWKTPLRNPISKEQEDRLADLLTWYAQPARCTRKRTRSRRAGGNPRRSRKPTRGRGRRTIKN